MKEKELIHIDDFTRKCGYFNCDTHIFSGYACEHPDCGDGCLTQYKNGKQCYVNGHYEISALAKSMSTRKISCNRRLAKKFVKKAKILKSEHNNKELAKYGFKWQGSCYASVCPLGYSAEDEDFRDFGEDPECFSEGEWLVVDKQTDRL